jgi:hypothetical protein
VKPTHGVQFSVDQTNQIREALHKLNRLLPAVDALQKCDDECREIAQMAALLQSKLTNYLHEFGAK